MSTARKSKMLPKDQLIMCDWSAPVLGMVVTLSEASLMWDKSHGALKNAVLMRKLEARRAFSGGDWLVTVSSLEKLWGKPQENILLCLKSE